MYYHISSPTGLVQWGPSEILCWKDDDRASYEWLWMLLFYFVQDYYGRMRGEGAWALRRTAVWAFLRKADRRGPRAREWARECKEKKAIYGDSCCSSFPLLLARNWIKSFSVSRTSSCSRNPSNTKLSSPSPCDTPLLQNCHLSPHLHPRGKAQLPRSLDIRAPGARRAWHAFERRSFIYMKQAELRDTEQSICLSDQTGSLHLSLLQKRSRREVGRGDLPELNLCC